MGGGGGGGEGTETSICITVRGGGISWDVSMDGVVFSIKLPEWGSTIQDFEGRKILASSDLKMGIFIVKKSLPMFYYLAIGLHCIFCILQSQLIKVHQNICAEVQYLATQRGSLIYWPQKYKL